MNKLIHRIIYLTVIILLTACQSGGKKTPQPVKVEDLSKPTILSAQEKTNQAIALLEVGNWQKAESILDEVIEQKPTHSTAVLLKKQLRQKAEDIFGTTKTRTYKVKQGDTLGAIAADWLENPLYFVALAKLNHIDNPSTLPPGKKIKIPVIKKAADIEKDKQQSKNNLITLNNYYVSKKYLLGLKKIESAFIRKEDFSKLAEIQNKLLSGIFSNSLGLNERKNRIDTIRRLNKKSKIASVRKVYREFINGQRYFVAVTEASNLYEEKKYLDAGNKIIEAKRINQKSDDISKAVEEKIISKLHEQAIRDYRNRLLEDALKLWQVVLELKPDFKPALNYSQKAETLLKKLKQYN